MRNSKDIHVLVIPSWYPPHGGGFFREHSQLLSAEGLNTGVIACHYKSLKQMSGSDILKTKPAEKQYIREVTEWHQDLLALPLFMRANMQRWVNRVMQLFESYTATHGQPDIIQAHSSMWAGYAAALISDETRHPLCDHRTQGTVHQTRGSNTSLDKKLASPLPQGGFSAGRQGYMCK
jgi:L-malate glycosyltransferase